MHKWIALILVLPISTLYASERANHALTLEQAIVNVLEMSPLLQAADYEAQAAAVRIRSARLSPAYKTSLELENVAGSGINQGGDNLETTLSLSKVLELGDKAELRGELAQQKALLLRNEQDAQRLDLLAETTRRFIDVASQQERLGIARNALSLVKRMQSVVQRRVKAGKAPDAELRRINIALARNKLELEHVEHQLVVSRLKLATLWGKSEPAFHTVQAELFSIQPVAGFASLESMMDNNPDLLRFATEQRLSQSRIALARSSRSSDIELSAGVRHFNDSGDSAMVFSFSMPLGTTSRAAADVDFAEAMGLRQPHLLAQRKLDLRLLLFEAHQEIQHAATAVRVYRKQIIPQAELALNDYEKGYNLGRYSFLELTQAQTSLLNARLDSVLAAADYHKYRIEIDRLTGAGLSSGVNQ